MISCGAYFTVCVDCEGFIWSFGENNCGQFGTGNTTNFNVPQKLQDIPPVLSVSCGSDTTNFNVPQKIISINGHVVLIMTGDYVLANIIFEHLKNISWFSSFIISK